MTIWLAVSARCVLQVKQSVKLGILWIGMRAKSWRAVSDVHSCFQNKLWLPLRLTDSSIFILVNIHQKKQKKKAQTFQTLLWCHQRRGRQYPNTSPNTDYRVKTASLRGVKPHAPTAHVVLGENVKFEMTLSWQMSTPQLSPLSPLDFCLMLQLMEAPRKTCIQLTLASHLFLPLKENKKRKETWIKSTPLPPRMGSRHEEKQGEEWRKLRDGGRSFPLWAVFC